MQSLISLQLTTWFCHDSKRDQYAPPSPINSLLKSLHFPQLLIFVSLSIQHNDTYLVNVFKWIRIVHVGHMYVFFPCCKHLQGPSKAQFIVYISLINKGLRQLSFSVTACIIYYCCDNSSIHLSYLFHCIYCLSVCWSYLIAALSSKLANVWLNRCCLLSNISLAGFSALPQFLHGDGLQILLVYSGSPIKIYRLLSLAIFIANFSICTMFFIVEG